MVGKLTSDTKLSGSLAPALMGQSHPSFGMSRNDLMAKTLNARGHSNYKTQTFSGSEAADFGNEFEGTIIKKAAQRLAIEKFNSEVTAVYDYEDLFSVSLDAIFYNEVMDIEATDNIFLMNGKDTMRLEGNGICESKLTSVHYTETPPPYRGPWQLQMQMMCYGATWGVIATLYQGTRLVLNVYEADPVMQSQLIEAAKDFYQRLDGPDWYPAMDSGDGARTFAQGEDHLPAIDLEPIADLALQYYDAKRAARAAEALAKSIEPKIMDAMGNHEVAYLNDETGEKMFELTWPTRAYKAQPEKTAPPKPARIERQKSLSLAAKWLGDAA